MAVRHQRDHGRGVLFPARRAKALDGGLELQRRGILHGRHVVPQTQQRLPRVRQLARRARPPPADAHEQRAPGASARSVQRRHARAHSPGGAPATCPREARQLLERLDPLFAHSALPVRSSLPLEPASERRRQRLGGAPTRGDELQALFPRRGERVELEVERSERGSLCGCELARAVLAPLPCAPRRERGLAFIPLRHGAVPTLVVEGRQRRETRLPLRGTRVPHKADLIEHLDPLGRQRAELPKPSLASGPPRQTGLRDRVKVALRRHQLLERVDSILE